MKRLVFFSFVFPLIVLASDIDVNIVNIKNLIGKLYVGLYTSEDTFAIVGKAYQSEVMNTAASIKYTFKNIPDGIYAIALFHDENQNAKLDENMLGIPKEGFGFSNNPKATFSEPTFDEAKFVLKNLKNLYIEVQYK